METFFKVLGYFLYLLDSKSLYIYNYRNLNNIIYKLYSIGIYLYHFIIFHINMGARLKKNSKS